jgi:SAM-dependent methyltransferase
MTENQNPLPASLYDEDYYLTACEGYEEFLETEGEHLSRRLKAAFSVAAIAPGMRILDVGSGRGEILRRCAALGAEAFGIDYAPAALKLSHMLLNGIARTHIGQSDAKKLPFHAGTFDRVLMLDIVEHLHPWELDAALLEARRVLKSDGHLIVHTAPNVWYMRYAYPLVRLFRILTGQGEDYPPDPRAFGVAVNSHVHVNEQSAWSLRRTLNRAGFEGKVWLDSPPQNRTESPVLAALRRVAFDWVPFRWFFEREVFAVVRKRE